MGNQDWSNLGDQIKNTVQSAIDSQNFRQLNDSIRNSVNSAIDNVNQSLNQANQRFNRGNMGNIVLIQSRKIPGIPGRTGTGKEIRIHFGMYRKKELKMS